MWCVLSPNNASKRCKHNIIYVLYVYIVPNRHKTKVLSIRWTYIFFFFLHLSLLHRKYKHWFYLANKTRATSYSTYVISIIISVSCQWVCLYRKFLFRSITSLHWIMGVCQIIVGSLYYLGEKNNVTRHLVLCLSHFPLVKITFM